MLPLGCDMGSIRFLVTVLVFGVHSAVAIVDYCDTNTYEGSATGLLLNKEASSQEYAVQNHFKGLHCCAKGYRSIEWYKEERPYPWPEFVSSLILYPESGNQTIYTQLASASDAGNYTCVMRNATHTYTHTVMLQVYEKIPDDPKVTYISNDRSVPKGHSVRFFCEAFLGHVRLPDAYNKVQWFRQNDNESLEEETPRIKVLPVTRQEEEIFGSYLTINMIQPEDFGEYVCRVSKPDRHVDLYVYLAESLVVATAPGPAPPWPRVAALMGAVVATLAAAAVLYVRYGLRVLVALKDRFGRLEQNDGKSNDVLICYSPKDQQLMSEGLMPVLESRYGFRCSCRELSTSVPRWGPELCPSATKTRRILLILSPGSLSENWDTNTLSAALRSVVQTRVPVTAILTRSPPSNLAGERKGPEGETVDSLLRRVGPLYWPPNRDFWLRLRLRLPAMRPRSRRPKTRLNTGPNLACETV